MRKSKQVFQIRMFVIGVVMFGCRARSFQNAQEPNADGELKSLSNRSDSQKIKELKLWLNTRTDEAKLRDRFEDDIGSLSKAIGFNGTGAHAFKVPSSAQAPFFSWVFPRIQVDFEKSKNIAAKHRLLRWYPGKCVSLEKSRVGKEEIEKVFLQATSDDPELLAEAYGLRAGLEALDLLNLAANDAKALKIVFQLQQIHYLYANPNEVRVASELHIDRGQMVAALPLTGKGTIYQTDVMSDDYFQAPTGRYLFFAGKNYPWIAEDLPKPIWDKAPDDLRQPRSAYIFGFERITDLTRLQNDCFVKP
jgi:hypothetical protein